MTLKPVFAAVAFAAIVCSTAPAGAEPLGPSSGFIPSYLGPQTAGFEIVSGEATLHSSTFAFDATFGGTVGDGVSYVWGVDRGSNLAPFTPNGRPGILFDAVVIYSPSVVSVPFVITDLVTMTPTFLSPSDVSFSGDTLDLSVPDSFLPSLGFSPNDYLVSLWTRDGLTATDFTQIAQFAPSDSVVPVTVPEPAPWAMLLVGLGAMGFMMRTRKQASRAAAV